MSIRLDKLKAERDKALARREQWQKRYEELTEQCRQVQAEEVTPMLEQVNLTPEQLAYLLSHLPSSFPTHEALMEAQRVRPVRQKKRPEEDVDKEETTIEVEE